VLCDVYDQGPNDEKVARESQEILQAIELETLHGQYKWSQILRRAEVQTGRRILLAYGMQFMNQMGGINLVVVSLTNLLKDHGPSQLGQQILIKQSVDQYYVTSGKKGKTGF
jgi:hypothetical protein